MGEAPGIEAEENGPFVVRGVTRMTGTDGAVIETGAVMELCRCGHSRTKPFCDGSHERVGFVDKGGEPAGPDRLLAYRGAEATVSFNPRLCAHSGECGRIARRIFDTAQKPWVQPDRGTLDEIAAVIRACPSGALKIAAPEGIGPDLYPEGRAQIVVQRHGPYWVLDVQPPAPPQGRGMSRRKYVLCRCGLSGTKPFCDGSHRDRGWRDDANSA